MKIKITRSAVLSSYDKVVAIPYCKLQTALQYETPWGFTASIYGWNADIYDIDGVALVTGYRPFGSVKPNYDDIAKLESVAKQIVRADLSEGTKRVCLFQALRIFCKYC